MWLGLSIRLGGVNFACFKNLTGRRWSTWSDEDDGRRSVRFIPLRRHPAQELDISGLELARMMARFGLSQGPVTVAANQGQYNLDQQKVTVEGPVKVNGPEGEHLVTRNVTVDLKQNLMTSRGGVAGRMELGQFQAGRLRADLNDRTIVLDGGTRLKIVQGAVR